MNEFFSLIFTCLILSLCFSLGTIREKRHYKSIKKREVSLFKKPYINFSKEAISNQKIKMARLVIGEVVLGCDRFKEFVYGLKTLFGGNVSVYESVLDRGKREALLRMREKALMIGADIVVNTKIETSMLDPMEKKGRLPRVSVIAYGTAIKYDN